MRFARVFVLGLAGLWLATCASAPATAPAERHRVHVDQVAADVRIAYTPDARRTGLQGVARLADDEGMLFVYPEPGRPRFWMQGCLIGLDVAFADAAGRIHQIITLRAPAESAPDDVDRAQAKRETTWVLEMPAGWFARRGLGIGARITLSREAAARAARVR